MIEHVAHLSEYLLIKPGGRLFFLNGGFSKDHIEEDVTDSVTRLLPMQCRIAPDATFRDILLLVKSKLPFFEDLLGLHCQEFVEEGLSRESPPEPGAYLELYWRADNSMGVLEGLEFPSAHEVVGENRETTRALSFIPSYQFSPLPVKLDHQAQVYLWSEGKKPIQCEDRSFVMGFTLFQILYGIFWELSFFSHPSNREQRAEELLGPGEKNETPNA